MRRETFKLLDLVCFIWEVRRYASEWLADDWHHFISLSDLCAYPFCSCPRLRPSRWRTQSAPSCCWSSTSARPVRTWIPCRSRSRPHRQTMWTWAGWWSRDASDPQRVNYFWSCWALYSCWTLYYTTAIYDAVATLLANESTVFIESCATVGWKGCDSVRCWALNLTHLHV